MRFAFLFRFAFSTAAYADVINPMKSACAGASKGDKCNKNGDIKGTCEPGKCCRLNYSGKGSKPDSVCEDCLRCTPSQAPSAGSAGDAPAGGSAGDAPASSGEDSGCISSANTPLSLGLLSIFVGFMLVVRLRRTRD